MANLQDYDYVPVSVPTLVDGQTVNLPRFLRVVLATGCNTVAGMADSTDFLDAVPAAPPGFQLKTRVCPQLDDIVVTADIADFTPDTPTTPGSVQAAAGTQYTYSGTLNSTGTRQDNPDRMLITVGALQNGKVSLSDSQYQAPSGGLEDRYILDDNEPYLSSLTGVSVSPRANLQIKKVRVNPGTPVYTWQASTVAYSLLSFN